MFIAQNLNKIKSQLPPHVTLVAVSKTKPVADLMEAYNAGQRIFGENKIQEMTDKWEQMPKDIEWHMIGHVQSNKVKFMAEYVSLIHGVDSIKLLQEINKQAKKHNRVIDCLLQIHIAEEETKFGLDEEELNHILTSDDFKQIDALHPDVVILGTGRRQRFIHPSLIQRLTAQRIGVECMDNHAACRTYNILMAEGRQVDPRNSISSCPRFAARFHRRAVRG